MAQLIFALGVLTIVLAAACFSVWHERFMLRGQLLCARVDAALRDAHGGETFVAVKVHPCLAWRRGRVVLSVPAQWDWLVKHAWDQVVGALPANYDLVVRR